MATERLFGNKIAPACMYCEEGFVSSGEESILCLKKGVVQPDFSCKSFRYDPLKRIPPRPAPLEGQGDPEAT